MCIGLVYGMGILSYLPLYGWFWGERRIGRGELVWDRYPDYSLWDFWNSLNGRFSLYFFEGYAEASSYVDGLVG